MKPILVIYVPVLHKGYLNLFKKYKDKIESLYLLGDDLIKEFFPLHLEIRALDPAVAKKAIEGLGIFKKVEILSQRSLKSLNETPIVAADEEISRKFLRKYFPRAKTKFEPVFLRWDEAKIQKTSPPKSVRISRSLFDRKIMAKVRKKAELSSDWWRQIGAAIVKSRKIILLTYSRPVPSEHMPYLDGDPRDFIPAGKSQELTTTFHAEQAIIAEAARLGLSLKGTSIYISAFPCPLCAKLIAYSGIKKCFFETGSATLDGERILKLNGVEIILVK